MRPRWWAGWRENAIQQSEEMPRVRACDEEERADRQGRPAVEMPGLPVELDDAAAAAQAGADAGGVPFLAAGAVIPKGGGLRGRRPRPAQTNRMVLAHPPAHRPAGRQAPHGHGGRHVHGPRLVPDHRHRRANRRGAGLAVVRARVQGRIPDPVLPASRAGRAQISLRALHVHHGLRGAEAACTQAWPGTRIQRCLVHVQRNTRTDLTSRPRLQAGRELKRLSDGLTSVETAGQAVRWGEALNAWHERWKDFIAERTYARDDPSNPKASRRRWWWTHEELRRCYRRLERLFREGRLFAYLEPELLKGGPVARTTNRLEGGVNSVVKDVLRNHRGLPEEHMRRACEWVCYMKTAHPRPESFIPDALRKGEKATTPEPDDSVAPAYGTGIDWNEFHTTTRYPNTTD